MKTSKILSLLILLGLLSFLNLQAQTEESKGHELKISIKEFRNSHGIVSVKLMDEQEQLVDSSGAIIENKEAHIIFSHLESANYTLLYFHDENENGVMDKNGFGIPKEGYGFSNNAIGRFGPPKLKERLFEIKNDTAVILYPFYQ